MNYNYFPGMAPRLSLIPTRGIEPVMSYPIVPGQTLHFIDETGPHIYVKTAGYPPFGQVTVDTYLLTKEGGVPETQQAVPETQQAAPDGEIARIWGAINEINKKMNGGDDHESESAAE